MADEPALAGVQRWMMARLADGSGIDDDSVVAPAPRMTATQCLDVYRRSYRLRLLECMREMFPTLVHVLGVDVFDAFASDYLAARPPVSYSLSHLADGFADHLAATRPEDEPGAWPELLIDVVRFELAFLEVYDGPGVEGERLPTAEDVPGEWPLAARLTVEPVPCLRLLCTGLAVAELVCAVRRGERPPLPTLESPVERWMALVRREYVVDVLPLPAAAYRVLEALFRGATAADAARRSGSSPADVLGWIASWADRGLFHHISVPHST